MIPSDSMDVNALNSFIANNLWLMVALAMWTLPWKGVALWKAAKRQEMIWFIAILVLNTVAILEIFYIFFVSRKPKIEKKTY